jgi:hypothetical protein
MMVDGLVLLLCLLHYLSRQGLLGYTICLHLDVPLLVLISWQGKFQTSTHPLTGFLPWFHLPQGELLNQSCIGNSFVHPYPQIL